MEYNNIKQRINRCPDLSGLDESSAAALFWRGDEQVLDHGAVVYAEDAPLDHTFCLLLSGDLIVEKSGNIIGGIFEQELFGEMAYFTNQRIRTATVRVGSDRAVIMKFRLSPAELASERFAALRGCLARQTWDRFVSTSQNAGDGSEMVTTA